ncbi:MAG: hypothetical protein HY814_02810 [Candidatus Riflebacteria bacterium]|nr:hypothetical protein [Candidatus Riflebacteria bacterium]
MRVAATAANRNPHVNTPGDRPETLDFARLARLTAALARALAKLANE